MKKEEWNLGAARAIVSRRAQATLVELRGVLTAGSYEALHARLGMTVADGPLTILMDWPLLLAVTRMSAAEAAFRGTPSRLHRATVDVAILVPQARLAWAGRHCEFMMDCGLSRRASALPEPAPWWERQAA